MAFGRSVAVCLILTVVMSTCSHHHHHPGHLRAKKGSDYVNTFGKLESYEKTAKDSTVNKSESSLNHNGAKGSLPFSPRRLEKMLEKAILKIITGNLSTSDMLLLKSLNYSLDEVLAFREQELAKNNDAGLMNKEKMKSEKRNVYDDNASQRSIKYHNHNSMKLDISSRANSEHDKQRYEKKKDHTKPSYEKDFDFDAYNRQAVVDYENLASKLEQQSWTDSSNLDYEAGSRNSKENDFSQEISPANYGSIMQPQIIFKIRYDDSEFDSSGSNEKFKFTKKTPDTTKTIKDHTSSPITQTSAASSNQKSSFHDSSFSSTRSYNPPLPTVFRADNFNDVISNLQDNYNRFNTSESLEKDATTVKISKPMIDQENSSVVVNITNDQVSQTQADIINKSYDSKVMHEEYEGLEWVEDDVYRVIPEIADSLGYDRSSENDSDNYENSDINYQENLISRENETDTAGYQNDAPDSKELFVTNVNFTADNFSANLSAYQQLALAHRRDQGQKAIEEIKSRILALTGRFNHTVNSNHVQRERLTMFSPSCLLPRNTDPEVWADPFSMNMHFQLNLTSGDHIVAAKLRIFQLPQENLTAITTGTMDEDEDDEKKIRISVYYYTKSLKKHRSKKRLMDSVVTPLTSEGIHLALDVRQGLKFWRANSQSGHGNNGNHGLVIQVEDQDGHPLKPALYIQEPSCLNQGINQKAYHRQPALFLRACTRYIRIVNGEEVMYVNCRSLRQPTLVK